MRRLCSRLSDNGLQPFVDILMAHSAFDLLLGAKQGPIAV